MNLSGPVSVLLMWVMTTNAMGLLQDFVLMWTFHIQFSTQTTCGSCNMWSGRFAWVDTENEGILRINMNLILCVCSLVFSSSFPISQCFASGYRCNILLILTLQDRGQNHGSSGSQVVCYSPANSAIQVSLPHMLFKPLPQSFLWL